MIEEKFIELIEGWSDDVVHFTCELIATPGVMPPGGEQNITRLLLDKFAQLGLDGATVASELPEPVPVQGEME